MFWKISVSLGIFTIMTTEEEVDYFLRDFRYKMKIWDILFRDDRGKNAQALVDLELRPVERITVLENLTSIDYSQGPLDDVVYGVAQMWVFGTLIKKKEVYIKISLGRKGSNVLCISFHLAEHKMNYPLKKKI